jgi:hypothetical protein
MIPQIFFFVTVLLLSLASAFPDPASSRKIGRGTYFSHLWRTRREM